MVILFSPKTPKFFCELCNTKTNNKKDYEKHLLTAKHKKKEIGNHLYPKIPIFICKNCNKEYKSNHGLWYHKKKCIKEDTFLEKEIQEIKEENIIITTLIDENKSLKDFMMIQQQEFKDLIVEVCKNNQINNTNNTFNNICYTIHIS